MRKAILILLLIISWNSLAKDRENFYIGEDLFYAGEYIKAMGLYNSINVSNLSNYELDTLYYRLAFFTNIQYSISVLSNSSLREAKELQSFLLTYAGSTTTDIVSLINTKDESYVYKVLENVDKQGIVDIDLSLKLYFSLSNFKDKIEITANDDFLSLKSKFINYLIYRNKGNEEKAKEEITYITNKFPDSFWSKILVRQSNLVENNRENSTDNVSEDTSLSVGYYLVIQNPSDVVVESMKLKNFSIKIIGNNLYIGPYKTQIQAQEEAQKISKNYKVQVRIVQIREQ